MIHMEPTPLTTGEPLDQGERLGGHTGAFLGGLVVVLLGSFWSLGATLLGPVVMALASVIWERRGRKLSATGHWLAAICGTTIVYVLFSGIVTQLTSEKALNHMRHFADSVQKAAAPQASPALLPRIPPRAAATQGGARATYERVQTFGIAFGLAFGALLWIGFHGSIAWAGGMIVGYGINERWPGSAAEGLRADSGVA
jgi:hypothetical protein